MPKSALKGAVLLVLIAVFEMIPLCAQSAKTALDIGGVTVWLGMSKKELLARCSAAGLYILKPEGNDFVIFESAEAWKSMQAGGPVKAPYYVVTKNEAVVFATREWRSSEADDADAVLGALQSLGNRTDCTISHERERTPERDYDKVFIRCGARTVVFKNGKLSGTPVFDISEEIGQP
jgi:hypothetical protein